MFCSYQDRQAFEDDLYRGDGEESQGSEAFSDLEFRLYGQLHYSSKEQNGELHVSEKAEETVVTGKVPHSAPSPETVKHKSKKGVKQKKKRGVPQVPRPLSPFEEVVVIYSSPEVITLSDSDASDDDNGVCALKGSKKPPKRTSTAHQQASLKSVAVSAPVLVDSSSSSSESESEWESESDSSDSDSLENWMILGRGQQDGDNCITLNLEAGHDLHSDVEADHSGNWLVLEKDKKAQIQNKPGVRRAPPRLSNQHNRYYTGVCYRCGRTGHLSKNCPNAEKMLLCCYLCGGSDHKVQTCPNRYCKNCGLPGHAQQSCNERPFYEKWCNRCGIKGHFSNACPEQWRQYHITTRPGHPVKPQDLHNVKRPVFCFNCSRRGHFGHLCTREGRFRGIYISTPEINYYDTKDIPHRVEELKNCGFIPTGGPPTPGPSKKKHKTYHQDNLFGPKRSRAQAGILSRGPNHLNAAKSHKKEAQQSTGAKRWKPKRAVPKKRPAPPQLIKDQDGDFPRQVGGAEKKKKKKKQQQDAWTSRGKSKKRKDEEMHPPDDDLFIIKQRKRKR
ncbi:zinc finger CCHC domain-containing protein 7 [Nerophis ophidion]|uniref:zinc finger CCHC domain-containing protein 7 n=1 Tax=Nerophis ophidion TaxID=159077 RepID=UPI002AE06C18|nr:zinc finger CCHC domain-containing protein 7 [Nerophis ophidion]